MKKILSVVVLLVISVVMYAQNTGYNETSIKPIIDEQNDGIVGIYQRVTRIGYKYKLACYKVGENSYKLIYLSSKECLSRWRVGDVKAELEPTAIPSMYIATWRMADKTLNSDCFVVFEGGLMKIFISGEEDLYVKLYPTTSANSSIESGMDSRADWSGTGFALKDNYLVTNCHVIEDAKSIWIQGVNGDFNTKHTASVVATDKFNDLALLKVEGVTVTPSDIPYLVKTTTSDVGEDVFVLGYPLTSTMGEEIKLTTGIVSSKTGFQGDVSLYQISAPIQPGNSGGPLFDGDGNVIGIVSAKHKGAENVGYAIKASYLRNLMESALSEDILPQTNKIASYKLSDKVKSLKNYVYYITCSSSSNSQSAPISGNSTHQSSSPSAKAYPSIKTTGGTLAVTGVEIKANETVLSLASTNNLSGGWMNISKGAHIIANGVKYTLVRVEGITYGPEYTYFAYQGETKNFKLYFQAIPQGTQTIDFIESSSSAWKIYGIPTR